ncbi:MAG: YhjD/YihY/BrkB family envelope integrity protein [Polyangiaceae bacterium]
MGIANEVQTKIVRAARDFYDFVWAVVDRAILAKIDTQAAQIAFNAVFAIAPLMTLTSILVSLIPAEVIHANVESSLSPYLPEQVRPLLDAQLTALLQRPSRFLVIVTVLGFLWTISSATGSISAALGEVGWRLHPQWLWRKLQAMILGIVMAVGLTMLAISASIIPLLHAHAQRLKLLSDLSVWLLVYTRWPLAGLVFMGASALFYRFGTLDRPHPKAVLLGGFFSGLTAVLASLLLRVYFTFAPYLGGMVGSAFTVFAGLLWLYALALGMMVGAVAAYVYEAETRGVGSELVPLLRALPVDGSLEALEAQLELQQAQTPRPSGVMRQSESVPISKAPLSIPDPTDANERPSS